MPGTYLEKRTYVRQIIDYYEQIEEEHFGARKDGCWPVLKPDVRITALMGLWWCVLGCEPAPSVNSEADSGLRVMFADAGLANLGIEVYRDAATIFPMYYHSMRMESVERDRERVRPMAVSSLGPESLRRLGPAEVRQNLLRRP